MQRSCELAVLPLSSLHKSRLYNAGYHTIADLNSVDIEALSKDTGLSREVCKNILTEVQKHDPSRLRQSGIRLQSAVSLYKSEQTTPAIVTFSEQVDKALGGGIQVGRLTEICGLPGVGKTQFCMQLACDVQIPTVFGGLDGEAVYIDAERTLIIDRLKDIVRSTVNHCHQIASSEEGDELDAIRNNFTEERMLSQIHYFSCHSYQELQAIINQLPEFLKEHENAKLVLIDSVAFHFRHSFEDLSLRTRLLTGLAQNLVKIARQHNVAELQCYLTEESDPDIHPSVSPKNQFQVVVTNQMTTRVADKSSSVVPALGESWGHACGTRLILHWEGNQRVAWLLKSPTQPQQKVPFQITTDGIRDSIFDVPSESHSCSENPQKRRKLNS